jgi:hypothetical protein
MYTPSPIINEKDQMVDYKIFLAGSIEMGKARRWQEKIFNCLKHLKTISGRDVSLYNPYRQDWDNNIANTTTDIRFKSQVQWEWTRLLQSDLIVVNFEENTKSPISLLELGAMAVYGKDMIVCCPTGFWKFGNVEFISQYYCNDIVLVNDFYSLLTLLKERILRL